MALSLNSVLRNIHDKAVRLAEQNGSLSGRIAELERENSSLRNELLQRETELESARRDIEFLTVSHRLADSPDTIISARRKIARLMKTIDNCISMLKEE